MPFNFCNRPCLGCSEGVAAGRIPPLVSGYIPPLLPPLYTRNSFLQVLVIIHFFSFYSLFSFHRFFFLFRIGSFFFILWGSFGFFFFGFYDQGLFIDVTGTNRGFARPRKKVPRRWANFFPSLEKFKIGPIWLS